MLLRVGYGDIGVSRAYLKFALPDIGPANRIIDARLDIATYVPNNNAIQINVHKVTQDWDSRNICWNNKPDYEWLVADYQMVASSNPEYFLWDITRIVKEWYGSDDTKNKNYGVMLKNADESSGFNQFVSSDIQDYHQHARPKILLEYVNVSELEDYWTYHSANAGRAGTAYVNDYTGNVVLVHNDVSIGGNLTPIVINHVYNSNNSTFNDIGFGNGWRTNYNQQIVYETLADNSHLYSYIDEDGTKHHFLDDKNGGFKDRSGLDIKMTIVSGGFEIKDKKDNILKFNSNGHLTSIEDANSNKINIDLDANSKIVRVYDDSNREVKFNYGTDGRLETLNYVNNANNTPMKYTYENGRLIAITYPDGKRSSYSYYEDGSINEIKNFDNLTVGLEYENSKIKRANKIKQYNATGILGEEISIKYEFNTTVFTDLKGNKDVYQFNNWGNTISITNSLGFAKYFDYKNDENVTTNKMKEASRVQKITNNLLKNHNAEYDDYWQNGGINGAPGSASFSIDASYYGKRSFKVEKPTTQDSYHMYQAVTLKKGSTYTLSGYVKTKDITAVNNKGARIFASTKDAANNTVYFESKTINGNTDWQRVETTFTLPENAASDIVYIALGITGESGTAYFDAVQLEEAEVANRYNLVENSDFSDGLKYWNFGSTDIYDNLVTMDDPNTSQGSNSNSPKGLDSNRFKFAGNAAKNKWAYQEVQINGKAGDVLTFNGWGKGNSVPLTKGGPRWFAIDLQFNYVNKPTEWKTLNFNPDSSQWQFASSSAKAKDDYRSVTVIFRYYQNQNEAFVDGFQLFKEEFSNSFDYDENGNLISTKDLNDKNSNFEYNEKNDLIKAIDPKGGIFKYTYDNKHNLTEAVTAENTIYSFKTDPKGNPISGRVGDPTEVYSDSKGYNTQNRFFVMDINGDQKDDLVTRDTDGNLTLWISNGTTLESSIKITGTGLDDKWGYASGNYFFVMDIDGDDKDDLVVRSSWGGLDVWKSDGITLNKTAMNGISEISDANGCATGNRFFIMDVNGDKKSDLVKRDAWGNLTIFNSDGTNLLQGTTQNVPLLTDANNFNTGNRFFVTDINGDKKDDLIVRGGTGTFVAYHTNASGTGFTEVNRQLISGLSDADGWNTGNRFMVIDIDGDGKKELVARYGWGEFVYFKSNGINFSSTGTTALSNASYADSQGWNDGIRFLPMDINGDGKGDFAARLAKGTFTPQISTGTSFQIGASILNPAFISTTAIYTDSGQFVKEINDNFDNKIKYTTNEATGFLENSTDAKENKTQYTPNQMGLVKKAETTLNDNVTKISSENEYVNDLLSKTTKNNAFSYKYDYDALGNQTKVSVENAQDPQKVRVLTTNSYLEVVKEGRRFNTGMIDYSVYGNNQKIGFEYDDLYRVTAKKYNKQNVPFADNDTIFKYAYDNYGNIGLKVDKVNNVSFRYFYDMANRLAQVKDTNDNILKYEYDANSNISKVSEQLKDKAFEKAYTYNKDNKLKSVSYGPLTNPNINMKTYDYDTIGRLINTVVKNSGKAIFNTQFSYAPALNGETSARINKISNNGKEIVYTHDKYGNIKSTVAEGKTISYTYDNQNQLIREDNQVLNKTIKYEYDLLGNITKKLEFAYTTQENTGTALNTISYGYDDFAWKDMLTSYNGKAVVSDEIGNTIGYDGYTFKWEMGRQLKGVSYGGKDITYKYDDNGIRTEKTVSGTTTKYTLEGSKVINETTGVDNIHYTYTANGSLLSMNYQGQEYYYIKNVQGDIIGLYDKDGTQVVSYTYDTWGKIIAIDGTLKDTLGKDNPYRYRSYRYDIETGLYYLQSRYYNPEWGRFINADAIVTGNEFAYCGNNPVMFTDSTGFQQMDWSDGGGGSLDGAVIRAMTPAEEASWNRSELAPYIPVVNTINSVKIILTGSDLEGFLKTPGEIQMEKQDLAFWTSVSVVGGALAKNLTAPKTSNSKLLNVDLQLFSEKVKSPVSGKSGKEMAKDVPSWAKGNKPFVSENGNDFAKRLLNEKYGSNNFPTGPGSEYNKIKKWGDRAFK